MGNVDFGKYKLIAELGHGGMADVFLAVQAGPVGSGFRKLTVIKRLRQNLADEPEFVAMLVDEARIAARLNHPNVVQTNEVGNVGNHYFIAMEYLDGQPLHRIQHRSTQKLKTNEPVPLTPAHQYLILMDTLSGLHHAHSLLDYDGSPLDIVHRDMTPQNIFLTYEGQVKVVDFGIAKAAGRSSETKQGVVKGKVRYMAPEQALGLPVTRRADVFAVGIMLWEAAVGKRMWKDKDELQIVRALVSGDLPPSPRELDPSVPEEIDAMVRKALSLRAEERFATAEDFRAEIEQYLATSGQLVSLRRQLAPMLSELFKDKRAEIRLIIEKQLSTVVDEAPSAEIAVLPTDSGTSSVLSFRPPHGSMGSDASPSSLNTNALSSATDVRASARRTPMAFVALGAIMVALVAVGLWRNSVSASNANHTTATADAGMISVQLSADPTSARVSVDDRPFEAVPLDIRVVRDDQVHHVRVEADGYSPKTETLSFAQDVHASFALSKKSEAAHSAEATAKTPPPAAHPVFISPFRGPVVARATEPKPIEPKVELPPPPPTVTVPATKSSASEKARVNLDKGDPWSLAK